MLQRFQTYDEKMSAQCVNFFARAAKQVRFHSILSLNIPVGPMDESGPMNPSAVCCVTRLLSLGAAPVA
jgi:hypothetical protein